MKVALKHDLFFPVAISDIKGVPTLAALFEVDSNYGGWPDEVATKDSCLLRHWRSHDSLLRLEQGPADWKALSVDIVIDCTGRATTRSGAQAHLAAGAKRVLMSAPKQEDCDGIAARSSESICQGVTAD
jgi:glyceraldehyde 3-phosphate dehydrogenase